ncbi:hypothetical protein STEG23_017290, partial [Scotinomys teguina]
MQTSCPLFKAGLHLMTPKMRVAKAFAKDAAICMVMLGRNSTGSLETQWKPVPSCAIFDNGSKRSGQIFDLQAVISCYGYKLNQSLAACARPTISVINRHYGKYLT